MNMMASEAPNVRVAVAQAACCWLDLDASVTKTISLIADAGKQGAEIIAFPEAWIPGYPAWIWSRPVDAELNIKYIKNSLKQDSPEMKAICESAKENNIIVCLGFSENHHDSLYISQNIISATGQILLHRRKLKATHMERTVFGEASGDSLCSVVDTNIGRVGALSCWEHIQPLLKYNSASQREQVHIAAWPPLWPHQPGAEAYSMSKEGAHTLCSAYAMETHSFTLCSTAVLSEEAIALMRTEGGLVMNKPGGGASAVFGPDGRKLSEDLPHTEEGIVYADVDYTEILRAKLFVDICGHYSRPDLMRLVIDKREKRHVTYEEDDV